MRDEIQRCSDDGEPQKTAGRPMLDVLLGERLHNVAVVVTRYFGGTLLGTGGLVRAYQGAVKEGLTNCVIIEKFQGIRTHIETDYNGIGKLQYLSSQMKITILDTKYSDIVMITALIPTEVWNDFQKKVLEATNGKSMLDALETVYYANVSGEVLLF
jgi:uncharacterized YigZ family protein